MKGEWAHGADARVDIDSVVEHAHLYDDLAVRMLKYRRRPGARARPDAMRRRILQAGLIALATVPYLNALENRFVYDDHAQVVRNTLVRSIDPRPVFAGGSVTHGRVEWYRPLTVYTLALNYAASTLRPFSYHLVNVALHAANTLLLFAVARTLLRSDVAALVAAALFATHAVHTEAVTPVFGRADLLAAFFVLLGWLLMLRWRVVGSWCAAVLSLVFLGGLLSKENAVAMLPVIFITAFGLDGSRRDPLGVRMRRTVAGRWPLWTALMGAIVIWVLLRSAATGAIAADWGRIRYIENPLIEAATPARIATALWVLIGYLRLFILPHPLSADYSFNEVPVIGSAADSRVFVLLAIAAGIGGLIAWARWHVGHTDRAVSPDTGGRLWILAGVFAVLLAPVANVFFPIGTIMAERLLYLPSAALCLIVGMAAAAAHGKMQSPGARVGLLLAIVSVVSAHALATVVRNRDWRSEVRLFGAAVAASPHSAKARFNYGSALAESGDVKGARMMLESAVAIAPAYPEAHNLLGTILLAAGDLGAAGRAFETSVEHAPAYAPALANLGTVRRREGRLIEARTLLERAIAADPSLAVAHINLALVADTQGDRATALDHYRRAYALDGTLEIARARAEALSPRPPR